MVLSADKVRFFPNAIFRARVKYRFKHPLNPATRPLASFLRHHNTDRPRARKWGRRHPLGRKVHAALAARSGVCIIHWMRQTAGAIMVTIGTVSLTVWLKWRPSILCQLMHVFPAWQSTMTDIVSIPVPPASITRSAFCWPLPAHRQTSVDNIFK